MAEGPMRKLPGLTGTLRVQIVTLDGKDLSGTGHTHSVVTSEDNTWTRGIHKFAYEDPLVHDRLYDIANSVIPEVLVITWSGITKISVERQWVTAVHELPSRSQGSREMRVETADLLWAMNRTQRTRPQRGSAADLVGNIARDYGMKSQCVTDTVLSYIQSRETDYEFLVNRLRTRLLSNYPYRGDFRLQVRSTADGTAILCFAPFRTPNRHGNWWYMNIADPSLGIHGQIEFVNQVPIRMAAGASGVRVIVADPYRKQFGDVQSPDFRALEAAAFQNPQQKTRNETGVAAPARFQYTVCDTAQEAALDSALALATGTAEAARMGNYEAVFTIAGQPWFIPGDKVSLDAAAYTPSTVNWFVRKCVTTISEGACDTHVIMVTDEPLVKQNGQIVLSEDGEFNPNTPLTPLLEPTPAVAKAPVTRSAVIPSDGTGSRTGPVIQDDATEAPTGLPTAAPLADLPSPESIRAEVMATDGVLPQIDANGRTVGAVEGSALNKKK